MKPIKYFKQTENKKWRERPLSEKKKTIRGDVWEGKKRRRLKESLSGALAQDQINTDVQITF